MCVWRVCSGFGVCAEGLSILTNPTHAFHDPTDLIWHILFTYRSSYALHSIRKIIFGQRKMQSTLQQPLWKSMSFNSPPFQALQPCSNPQPSDDGKTLRMSGSPGSVLWRAPFPAPGVDASTAGLWGFKRKIGLKGFEVRCEVEIDQKGLRVSSDVDLMYESVADLI